MKLGSRDVNVFKISTYGYGGDEKAGRLFWMVLIEP
jgi:hypothetical protein